MQFHSNNCEIWSSLILWGSSFLQIFLSLVYFKSSWVKPTMVGTQLKNPKAYLQHIQLILSAHRKVFQGSMLQCRLAKIHKINSQKWPKMSEHSCWLGLLTRYLASDSRNLASHIWTGKALWQSPYSAVLEQQNPVWMRYSQPLRIQHLVPITILSDFF